MALEGDAAGYAAIGAGLAVGLSGIGSGMGEKDAAAAAIGAITEDKGMFGRAMIFVIIPETIVIFGLVIAIIALFAL
ncbi:MAG: ATPase [Methanomassiliicoccaceae archaeon]|nr:ATPase [Methanomassiliicoccaceae archaeon]